MKRNSTGQGHLTNKNGKPFEKIVLADIIEQLKLYESTVLNVNCYKDKNNEFLIFEQSNFYKYANNKYQVNYKEKTSKKYVADLWVLKNEKELYLIEVKSQKASGSTDEKIYGGLMLNEIYKEVFDDMKFSYKKMCYITNDFFENNKYDTAKKILKKQGIEFYINQLDINWLN